TGKLESMTRGPADIRYIEGTIGGFEINLVPDQSYYDSRYVFELVKPTQSRELTFSDESLSISFAITNMEMGFTIINRSEAPLALQWDAASFIDLSNAAHRVIHKGVKLVDRDKPQPASIIPPGTTLTDTAYPADFVSWNQTINDWWQQPILP